MNDSSKSSPAADGAAAAALSGAEVAALVGGVLHGDAPGPFRDLRDLRDAGPHDVAFFAAGGVGARPPRREDLEALAATRAGLLLVADSEHAGGRPHVLVADPHLAAARVLRRFVGADAALEPAGPPDVDPSAVVSPEAELGVGVRVGPFCVVGRDAVLGPGVVLHERVSVGAGVHVGAGTHLYPGVVLYPNVRLGERCTLHANVVLGAPGFGYAWDGARHLHVPQRGGVVVGDGVEIGVGSTVDAGTFRPTEVGDGCILDDLVQVGHNCRLGRHVVLCGQVGLAGGVEVGDGAVLGGQAGVGNRVRIGPGARVAGQAAVFRDVPPGGTVAGSPAVDYATYRRMQARLRRMGRHDD